MNRRSGWVLIGLTLAVIVVLLAVARLYFPVGLLVIAALLYAIVVVLLLVILRTSKRKQAV